MAFLIFGVVPLIPYVLAAMMKAPAGGSGSPFFVGCCLVTVAVMFGLGSWTVRTYLNVYFLCFLINGPTSRYLQRLLGGRLARS
jgi:hypothetical protein